jgi:ectoine hydroxylase-related dioxygenase (phytanoyl-CoA dioxygenase family)
MPTLEHVSANVAPQTVYNVLQRDGAVVIENILSRDALGNLNNELDALISETAPGLRHPAHERMVEFYGHATVRFDGLPGKSESFLDVMLTPLLCGAADHFLLANCHDYIFNTGQLIQIGPGEDAQRLHRDEDAWGFLKAPKPTLQVEAMFALSDFTIENGATQVVPGSHLWPPDREPRADEVVQAEMPAGSALMYLGSAIHGGGANTTRDQHRRGMFLGYVVGWLRAEENSFLTVPMAKVRQMPVRIQELLGYKAHEAIGVVDVGSPMVLLR